MGIGQPYLSSLEGGKFGSSLTHALRLLRFVGCEVLVRPPVALAERMQAVDLAQAVGQSLDERAAR